jgi:hypothetical protein
MQHTVNGHAGSIATAGNIEIYPPRDLTILVFTETIVTRRVLRPDIVEKKRRVTQMVVPECTWNGGRRHQRSQKKQIRR